MQIRTEQAGQQCKEWQSQPHFLLDCLEMRALISEYLRSSSSPSVTDFSINSIVRRKQILFGVIVLNVLSYV